MKRLFKGFTVNTISNMKIHIPKNTLVSVKDNIIFFHPFGWKGETIKGFRVGKNYFIEAFGGVYRLQPFNPHPPFPFSMLR